MLNIGSNLNTVLPCIALSGSSTSLLPPLAPTALPQVPRGLDRHPSLYYNEITFNN